MICDFKTSGKGPFVSSQSPLSTEFLRRSRETPAKDLSAPVRDGFDSLEDLISLKAAQPAVDVLAS